MAAERQDVDLAGRVALARSLRGQYTGRPRVAGQHAERALRLFGDSYSTFRGGPAAERVLARFFAAEYAALDPLLPEASTLARRIGHLGLAWIVRVLDASLAFVRTRDLRAWQRFNQEELEKPLQWRFVSHWFSADAAFLLGEGSRLRETASRFACAGCETWSRRPGSNG